MGGGLGRYSSRSFFELVQIAGSISAHGQNATVDIQAPEAVCMASCSPVLNGLGCQAGS